MKSVLLTLGSVVLTTGVVMNAYSQKKQFYPSVVYITKSSPSMAVLYMQAFVMVILMGKFMRKIFFGQLRPAETEHLIERSWYAVTETCLAFTVFRDDFSPRFVALFTMLLFLKCFHWLAEDRIDYMERSPVISFVFHVRAAALLLLLSFLDGYFVNHAYDNTLIKGPSVQLVFGFEYAILFTAIIHIFVKYILHTIDLHSDNPWENKAVYLLYTELLLGFVKVILYLMFLAIMIKVHTFPLFVIRPMYLTVREFKKALNDVVMSRRAIHNMNTLYPDATASELASGDNVCIICREEMHGSAKKLPCNHIFHTSCLRSWFQRQQTCPTCRMDVFRSSRPQTQPVAQPPPPPQQPILPGAFPVWQPNILPHAHQLPQGQTFISSLTGNLPGASLNSSGLQNGSATVFPPFMSAPLYMPFGFASPPVFSDLSGLNDEELRNLEGEERRNVEARIQCLQDIQTLLSAAIVQIQQYTASVSSSSRFMVQPSSLMSSSATISHSISSSILEVSDHCGASVSFSQHMDTRSSVESKTNETVNSDGGERECPVEYADSKNLQLDISNECENHVEANELLEIRKRRVEHFSSSEIETNNKTD